MVIYEGFAVSSFNRDPEVAAVDRSDPAKNRYRQLPTASALGSVLVHHSLAAGGCWPRVTRENDGSGSSLLWVAVKRYSHHAFQAYLKATRSAGGFFIRLTCYHIPRSSEASTSNEPRSGYSDVKALNCSRLFARAVGRS